MNAPKFQIGDVVHPRFDILQGYAMMLRHEKGTTTNVYKQPRGDYYYEVTADDGYKFYIDEDFLIKGGKANENTHS